jgi:hypothetical protein
MSAGNDLWEGSAGGGRGGASGSEAANVHVEGSDGASCEDIPHIIAALEEVDPEVSESYGPSGITPDEQASATATYLINDLRRYDDRWNQLRSAFAGEVPDDDLDATYSSLAPVMRQLGYFVLEPEFEEGDNRLRERFMTCLDDLSSLVEESAYLDPAMVLSMVGFTPDGQVVPSAWLRLASFDMGGEYLGSLLSSVYGNNWASSKAIGDRETLGDSRMYDLPTPQTYIRNLEGILEFLHTVELFEFQKELIQSGQEVPVLNILEAGREEDPLVFDSSAEALDFVFTDLITMKSQHIDPRTDEYDGRSPVIEAYKRALFQEGHQLPVGYQGAIEKFPHWFRADRDMMCEIGGDSVNIFDLMAGLIDRYHYYELPAEEVLKMFGMRLDDKGRLQVNPSIINVALGIEDLEFIADVVYGCYVSGDMKGYKYIQDPEYKMNYSLPSDRNLATYLTSVNRLFWKYLEDRGWPERDTTDKSEIT